MSESDDWAKSLDPDISRLGEPPKMSDKLTPGEARSHVLWIRGVEAENQKALHQARERVSRIIEDLNKEREEMRKKHADDANALKSALAGIDEREAKIRTLLKDATESIEEQRRLLKNAEDLTDLFVDSAPHPDDELEN